MYSVRDHTFVTCLYMCYICIGVQNNAYVLYNWCTIRYFCIFLVRSSILSFFCLKMLLSSKRYLLAGFVLSNEKYNFSFVRSKPIRSTSILSGLFIRCDMKYTLYADSNLIAFSMVSTPSFIASTCRGLIRNSRRVFLTYKLYSRTFFRVASYLFFSYLYTSIRSRVFFF
jgi:hypothetical protein